MFDQSDSDCVVVHGDCGGSAGCVVDEDCDDGAVVCVTDGTCC